MTRLASALALAGTLFVAREASADLPPLTLPLPNGPVTVVMPGVDLSKVLGATASCPKVEIAPGVFVPIPCGSWKKAPVDLPPVRLPPVAAPVSVDLRNVGLDGPIKDQRATGVCYAFALSTVTEDSLRHQGRTDVLSPLHVVAAKTWDEMWRGTTKEAIVPESAWPYDPIKACRFESGHDSCEQSYGVSTDSWRTDAGLVAERERARSGAGVAFVGKPQKLEPSTAIDSIVSALARGQAVFVDVAIDTRTWSYGRVRSGVLDDWEGSDGGHAVVVVGERLTPTGRELLIHNSWGTSWGERGYAWIREATLTKHLEDALLIDAVPTAATPVAPTPTPPSATCGAGTVLDVGTGRCEKPCPSGFAPAFGRCWLG